MTDLATTAKQTGTRMTVLGVIAIILGVLSLLAPGLTGFSVVTMLGAFALLGGVLRMIWAFKAGSLGKGLVVFAIGGLTLLCGLAILANPLIGMGALTIVLAVYFIVDGIMEISASFQPESAQSRGWLIFGGIVSILLGVMIWAQYPLSGVWAIGTLLGIKLFFVGLLMVNGGAAVRSMADRPV